MKNIIFHIDVNSAFLSWEAVYRLAHKGEKQDLREVVSAVGGNAALRRGIILAKSIPAKSYGIKTGETILEAQRKCRELVLVPPNYRLYEKCSGAFMEILQKYSDAVEPYSIDEAFVDMSTSCCLFGTPEETAEQIKDHIRKELGFTVNVGVSSNKLLAKMASDFQKPDRVHTLYPEEIQKKMWPLPVSDLFFVGRAAAGRLFSVGIRTIGELAKADPAWLKSMLKKQGELVGSRLRADRVQVCVVSVGVRYTDFAYASHQKKLQSPTNLTLELYGAARRLFRELWNQRPVRHLGVHTSGVSGSDTGRQLSIFDEIDYEKLGRMDQTVDGIRKRFGEDAVRRAVFLEQPADDRNGGRGDGIWNWYKPAGSGRGQCQGNTGENCL